MLCTSSCYATLSYILASLTVMTCYSIFARASSLKAPTLSMSWTLDVGDASRAPHNDNHWPLVFKGEESGKEER
jgi:hypothetical protein